MDETGVLKAVQQAMRLEGIPEESIEHVLNRLVYGDPHGPVMRQRASEDKVQIHLTVTPTLDPSEFARHVRTLAMRTRGNLSR